METSILDARADLSKSVGVAVDLLRSNSVVALPTETVYGLAGLALSPEAVAKIFEAKQRPSFDPLIVHIGAQEWLEKLVRADSSEAALVSRLIKSFWPGPLTILFPKTELVPDIVTAGSQNVAIRMPDHPIFAEVLRRLGEPLAAPSANRFGRVSPTRAEHVLDELNGKIPLILDFGPTTVGLESTIVRLVKNQIEILRPGPITEEALGGLAPVREPCSSSTVTAPGQMSSHYAPEKPVYLFDESDLTDHSKDSALLCWGPAHDEARFLRVRSLSESYNLREAAQRLFQLLREMDRAQNVNEIFVETVPETGLGKAIMNRVRRAFGGARKVQP
jgi:L-threonylcarbamoyladenylate synthase